MAVQAAVSAPLPGVPAEAVVDTLHSRVSGTFHQLFPKNRVSRTHAHHDKHALRHLQFMPNFGNLIHIFQAWHQWSRFHFLQRQQQKQARQARRAKFHELCHNVQCAANRHDAHLMFQVINRYSPKKPLVRARLRTSDGKIADQFQAHALTAEFVRHTWQGPSELPRFSATGPGVPFTLAELTQALAQLHPNKSVAQPFLPAVVWRSTPVPMANFLMHCGTFQVKTTVQTSDTSTT